MEGYWVASESVSRLGVRINANLLGTYLIGNARTC